MTNGWIQAEELAALRKDVESMGEFLGYVGEECNVDDHEKIRMARAAAEVYEKVFQRIVRMQDDLPEVQ